MFTFYGLSHGLATRRLASSCARAAFMLVCVATTGCTSMLTPLGSEKYDCNRKEDPTSPYCHSFRSVVQGTNGALPDSRYDQVMRLSDYDRLTGIAPDGGSASGDEPPHGAQRSSWQPQGEQPAGPTLADERASPAKQRPVTTPAAVRSSGATTDAPVPVRVGPLVQRVWIKRYVDDNDMLVSNTYVYKEIVPAHWTGVAADANSASGNRGETYPHRPPQPAAAAASATTDASSNRPAATAAATEFAQPGRQVRPADVVPSPTTSNGTPSLPQ